MDISSPESGLRDATPACLKWAVVRHAFLLSLLSFLPALLIAIAFVFLRTPGETVPPYGGNPMGLGFAGLTFVMVLVGPFIETALFQLLVIEILLKVRVRRAIYIVPIAAALFAGVHLSNPGGVASAVSVIPGGFVLAWCYLHWRRTAGSRVVAFSATWLTHGLHNLYYQGLHFVPASIIFG
jgi:hypothetical protein